MFIYDGLFIELKIGDRRGKSVSEWGDSARCILSEEAINEEKGKGACEWANEQIFLGSAVNTSNASIVLQRIKLPDRLYCLAILSVSLARGS